MLVQPGFEPSNLLHSSPIINQLSQSVGGCLLLLKYGTDPSALFAFQLILALFRKWNFLFLWTFEYWMMLNFVFDRNKGNFYRTVLIIMLHTIGISLQCIIGSLKYNISPSLTVYCELTKMTVSHLVLNNLVNVKFLPWRDNEADVSGISPLSEPFFTSPPMRDHSFFRN